MYLDRLLRKLQAAGTGCRIGNLFLGVFAYADGIALLAHTVHAMRYVLKLCDDYAMHSQSCLMQPNLNVSLSIRL